METGRGNQQQDHSEDHAHDAVENLVRIAVADIGDNDATRSHVTIYRVPEPSPRDAETAVSEAFHATYPDGPHDAEAFFVTDAGLFIVTKGDRGPVALYRFPTELRSGATVQGEGVSIGPDSTVYLVGEGGGHSRPGTLARLNCTLGP